jgi:hypothetical protein
LDGNAIPDGLAAPAGAAAFDVAGLAESMESTDGKYLAGVEELIATR